jgi:hypothetical protein
MASVSVFHNPSRRLEGGVEQGGVAMLQRGFVKKHICAPDQGGEIGCGVSRLRTKGGLDTCHHQRGAKSLSGYISDRNAEFPARKTKNIIKISAHCLCLPAHCVALYVFERRNVTPKKSLLDDSHASDRSWTPLQAAKRLHLKT